MPAFTYNFTYSAIATHTMQVDMTVYGGLYGCKDNLAILRPVTMVSSPRMGASTPPKNS